jgi:hypothetical protein
MTLYQIYFSRFKKFYKSSILSFWLGQNLSLLTE